MTILVWMLLSVLMAQQAQAQSESENWLRYMQVLQLERMSRNQRTDAAHREAHIAAREAAVFAEQFNNLVQKLSTFADQYNGGTVDARAAKSLREAWTRLEKTNAWFRAGDSKGGGDRCPE